MVELSQPATLLFHPERKLLEITWPGPASSASLRADYREVLTHIAAHPVQLLLFDVRCRGQASEDDQKWVAQEFLPQLPPLMPRARPRLAYLLLPALYDSLLATSPDGTMITESELLTLAYFTDKSQALAWLESPL